MQDKTNTPLPPQPDTPTLDAVRSAAEAILAEYRAAFSELAK